MGADGVNLYPRAEEDQYHSSSRQEGNKKIGEFFPHLHFCSF